MLSCYMAGTINDHYMRMKNGGKPPLTKERRVAWNAFTPFRRRIIKHGIDVRNDIFPLVPGLRYVQLVASDSPCLPACAACNGGAKALMRDR